MVTLGSATPASLHGGRVEKEEERIMKRSVQGVRRMIASAVALGLAAVLLLGCGGDVRPADGETSTTAGDAASGGRAASLSGAGATFPEPLYLEWIGEYITNVQPNVSINYQGIGSGGGIQQFTQMTVDYGASDAPMEDEEIAAAESASGAKVLHIPTVFGAVVPVYNLEGVDQLRLDQETLAGVFLGDITTWNDPKIAALNSGTALPDEAIQVVHRSDSSGTTSIFTGYLAQTSSSWESGVGAGKEVQWPVGIGGQGNDGVAAVVQQRKGSLGYVELSYAVETGLRTATLRNKAGNFVEPSLDSTSAAGAGIDFPEDLRFSLSDSASPDAYPIVGATWILAYDQMRDQAKAAALKSFLTWCLQDGNAIARDLGYAPLPPELKNLALAKVEAINATE